MKKYLKYIMVLIIGLFVFNGINVKAESLCTKAQSSIFAAKNNTICSWTYNETVNGSATYYKVNLYFAPNNGIWRLNFDGSHYDIKDVKNAKLGELFSIYGRGSYKYDSKNFACPKSISKIKISERAVSGYKLDYINFETTTNSASKINADYPQDIKKYVQNIKDEINKLECNDKNLKKVKGDVTEKCSFTKLCPDKSIGKSVQCTAAAAPLTHLIEAPQDELKKTFEQKSKSCNCDEYSDSKDKENCNKNKEKLEEKAEKIEENTESVVEKVSEAEEKVPDYNYKRVVIDEEEATCEGILSKEGTEFLQKVLKFVQYGGVIVALLSSTLDFIKSVSSGSQDDLKKASSRFLKRMIFAALLFFVVILTNILLGIFNITVPSDCV